MGNRPLGFTFFPYMFGAGIQKQNLNGHIDYLASSVGAFNFELL